MSTEKKKKVSFDAVEIREYSVVLSDNPATRSGPSLEIGWEYRLATEVQPIGHGKEQSIDEGRVPLNEYETIRPSAQRRPFENLYLFLPTRHYRIKRLHYTDAEIADALARKAAIFASRERSNFYRNPFSVLRAICIDSVRRTKRVKRAVRNLKKPTAAATDHNIYRGWWWPLSAHCF